MLVGYAGAAYAVCQEEHQVALIAGHQERDLSGCGALGKEIALQWLRYHDADSAVQHVAVAGDAQIDTELDALRLLLGRNVGQIDASQELLPARGCRVVKLVGRRDSLVCFVAIGNSGDGDRPCLKANLGAQRQRVTAAGSWLKRYRRSRRHGGGRGRGCRSRGR